MKSLLHKLTIIVSLAIMITACFGGGGGGFAGIGGSGYISTGTVTGFGSVFVNGVEFETNAASFEIEDVSGSQSDLRIGMVVQVEGSINADGVTGTATRIHYGDDLEGPINTLVEDVANMTKTLTIMGVTVVISSADTAFEAITYGSLLSGNVVEVSGFYDDAGVLQASYLEFKSNSYTPATIFEIHGVISGLSGSVFTLRGLTIEASSANLSDLPNGLQNGAVVEVKGTYDGALTITATSVEGEDDGLVDDGSKVSVEGYITDFVSINNFKIDGYPVNGSAATLEPTSLVLNNGIKVEAEGTVSNGVLNASEIESRGGDAEVNAYVDSIDGVNNRFTVEVVSGEPVVTVQLSTATLMEDDVGVDDHLLLSELQVGNFVEVRGYETASDTITATRVKRADPEDIELQGIITAEVTNTSVTVLGVTFPVDPSTTEYEDENEMPYANHTDFAADVVLNQTVISIEDKQAPDGNAVGIADKVEIEIP